MKKNDKKYCELIYAHFVLPHYLEKYRDMITIELNNEIYELSFTLPNTSFNKELLKKLFGVTIVTGGQVKAIFKHKDFSVVSNKIKTFLDITNLLK